MGTHQHNTTAKETSSVTEKHACAGVCNRSAQEGVILCESKVDTNGSGCDPVGNSGSSGNLCGILGTGVQVKEKHVKVTEKHNAPSERSDSLQSYCLCMCFV